MPLYQLFIGLNERPTLPPIGKHAADKELWGSSRHDTRKLARFCRFFERMAEPDRNLLMLTAQKMQRR
jgi:hypothetical protein